MTGPTRSDASGSRTSAVVRAGVKLDGTVSNYTSTVPQQPALDALTHPLDSSQLLPDQASAMAAT
jgi:hypothetical protein